MDYARRIVLYLNRPQHRAKLKLINRFCDNNRDSQIFWEILPSIFACFFIFGNMFPESQGFVAMPVTSSIIDICSNHEFLK